MNGLLTQLEELTQLDLDGVRLSEVNALIKQNTLEIVLVCPEGQEKALSDESKRLTEAAKEILKTSFKVKLKIKKSYFEEAYFTYALLGFFEKFPMIKNNIKSENFAFEYEGDKIKAIMKVPAAISEYIKSGDILAEIKNFIHNNYCENIEFELMDMPLESEEIVVEEEENKLVYDYEGGRHIKVSNVESFIGDPIYEKPSYITDVHTGDGIVLCGRIREFTERKRNTKEGEEQKYFFKFRLEDFTGSINCIYFPSKKSIDKIRTLYDGKEIVAFGSVQTDTFRGVKSLTYKVRFISLCTLPEDFVINRARMVVPSEYKHVHPYAYEEYEQDNLFKEKASIPPYLLGKEFVVYDLETTGLNRDTDRIIEIGAVKLKDGVITEAFSTLVDPQCLISRKTVELTGITDADVKGAPIISEVMPDFYKFCFGAIMVGQNSIQFDWPFVRAKAEPMNIYFENEQLDVMILAKRYYPDFGRFNLDFMSRQFGIVNEEAHRAVSDAVTTAKVFMKLAEKMK